MKLIYTSLILSIIFSVSVSGIEIESGNIIITEIMINPNSVPDKYGEYLELYNPTDRTYNLYGLIIKDNDRDYHIISSNLTILPMSYIVLCRNNNSSKNGGIMCDYEYSNFKLSNTEDEIILMHNDGTIIDKVYYNKNNWIIPNGASLNLDPDTFDSSLNDNPSNWCKSTTVFGNGDYGTPGRDNKKCYQSLPEFNSLLIAASILLLSPVLAYLLVGVRAY